MINNNNRNRGFSPAISAAFINAFYYETFDEFRLHLGYSIKQVAQILDKSDSTVKRYIRLNNAPDNAFLLLYINAGYLPYKGFERWRIVDGQLYTGTQITRNRGFLPTDIINWEWWHDYRRTLEQTIQNLKKQLQEAHSQPNYVKKTAEIIPFRPQPHKNKESIT